MEVSCWKLQKPGATHDLHSCSRSLLAMLMLSNQAATSQPAMGLCDETVHDNPCSTTTAHAEETVKIKQ
jgi:hypothetical protein